MCVLLKGGVGVSTPTFFISGTGSGTPDRVPPVRPSLAGREPACQRWSSASLPECNVGKSYMIRTGRRQPNRGLDTAARLPPLSALTRCYRPESGRRRRCASASPRPDRRQVAEVREVAGSGRTAAKAPAPQSARTWSAAPVRVSVTAPGSGQGSRSPGSGRERQDGGKTAGAVIGQHLVGGAGARQRHRARIGPGGRSPGSAWERQDGGEAAGAAIGQDLVDGVGARQRHHARIDVRWPKSGRWLGAAGRRRSRRRRDRPGPDLRQA